MATSDVTQGLGVIIAGGKSRRFNIPPVHKANFSDITFHKNILRVDKFLAPFGKTTLLGHIIARAKKQITPLLLNANGEVSALEPYGLAVISDDIENVGPLGGIAAACKAAHAAGCDYVITFSGDSPYFPEDYVSRMVKASDGGQKIAVASSDGQIHPVMALWPVALQDDLHAYLRDGGRRLMVWIEQNSYEKVVWDNKIPDPFFNINCPEDLIEAEKYLDYSSGSF